MNNTEKEMINAVFSNKGLLSTTFEIAIPNCFTQHDNEADLFFIRKSGFCDEVEIKVSRSDLLSDKKKRVWYRNLEYSEFNWNKQGYEFCPSTKPKYDALIAGEMKCNYFWYALKEGIGGIEDIPEFAGLLIIKGDGSVKLIRSPDRLHRNKLSFEQRYKFSRLLHYRFWGNLA